MRYLFATFISFYLFPYLVLAQEVVSSDFYFYIHPQDYNSLLSQKQAGSYDEIIPSITIEHPYSTVAEDIHIKMNYQYEVLPEQEEFTKYNFQAKLDNLNMSVEKIVTDDVITPVLGNVHLNIDIKGECQNLSLKHTGAPVAMNGQLEVVNIAGKIFIKVNNLNVNFDHNWDIDVGNCEGPYGYDQTLKQAILEFLKDKNFIGSYLGQQLQNKVNSLADELTRSVLRPQVVAFGDKAELRLEPSDVLLEGDSGLLKVKGTILSQFSATSKENYIPFVIQDDEKINKSGFVISQNFLKKVSSQLYNNKFYQYKFESKNIEGFKTLMNSRFFQFFLFPDLMNFDKQSNFYFDSLITKDPKVSIIGGKLGYLWFGLDTQIGVEMRAPTEQGYVPYIHFQSDFSTKGWMSVSKERLNIGFYIPKMSLEHEWDKNYVTLNRPSQRFSKSYFLGKLIAAFSGMRFDYQLPTFEVYGFGKFTPVALEHSKEWVQLVYKSAKQVPANR